MVGLVDRTGHEHEVEFPLQMTVALTDGHQMWAFRYSSQGASRSLYYSTEVEALRALHPELAILREVSDETRLIVSESLGDLPRAWNEVPRERQRSGGARSGRPARLRSTTRGVMERLRRPPLGACLSSRYRA